jgi:hypothetical protein
MQRRRLRRMTQNFIFYVIPGGKTSLTPTLALQTQIAMISLVKHYLTS